MIGRRKKDKKRAKKPMTFARGEREGRKGFRFRPVRLLYLLVLLLGVALGWVGWQIPGLFTEADSFELAALEVDGLRLLSGQEILNASGLHVGDNIFAVDLRKVEAEIEKLPWVKSALVTRRPPDRLGVRICERRRLAWIDVGQIMGVDADGVLLPGRGQVRESYRDLDLPVIGGLNCRIDSLELGRAVVDSSLGRLLTWWQQASSADAEFCMNISEIQPLGGDGIRLRLVGDGLEVRLPADRVKGRIRVLKKLMKRVYRECPEPAYIDMRFAGQVVVGSKERNS